MYSHAELHAIGIAGKDRERMERCNYYSTNLWALCTEVLGYDRLTEEFHKPMLDDIDRQRREDVLQSGEIWARGHYKSTIEVGEMIQDWLIDENATSLILHAVEGEAQKVLQEVGHHCLNNKELKRLKPAMFPHVRSKKFLLASQFTLHRDKFNRQPSLFAKGVNSELTGVHINHRAYLDDIIGRNTIEDSGLPKTKSWLRNTLMPVLDPGAQIRFKGTRWDIDDPYGDWIKSKHWEVRVRAALETDGAPDYKGKPVLFDMKEIQRRRREMGESDFAFQMMNDPSPSGQKPWNPDKCEHTISLKELADCEKAIFVLGDPAPAKVGSARGEGEQKRADGTKDDWANAVILWATRKQRSFAVLIDGSFSKDWGMLDGCKEMARLMLKWKTANVGLEVYGGLSPEYERYMRQAASTAGTSGFNWIDFKNSYASGAKNLRFRALADLAKEERFYICHESCPEEYVEKLLPQLRNWMPLEKGRNSLKFDDLADVTARCTDSALQMFSPQAGWDEPDMFFEDEPVQKISRYCGW